MHNPVEMVTFRNPPNPVHRPAPYRSADNPGDPTRQDDGGDLDEVGKNKDLIEQVPLELLEIGHQVLPDRERFDFRLPSADASAVTGDPGWRIEHMSSMWAFDVRRDVLTSRVLRPRFKADPSTAIAFTRESGGRLGRVALRRFNNLELALTREPRFPSRMFRFRLGRGSGGRSDGESA